MNAETGRVLEKYAAELGLRRSRFPFFKESDKSLRNRLLSRIIRSFDARAQ